MSRTKAAPVLDKLRTGRIPFHKRKHVRVNQDCRKAARRSPGLGSIPCGKGLLEGRRRDGCRAEWALQE